MFDDTYHTIITPAEGLYKEKGSKFIACAFPVTSEVQVKEHLEKLRKSYFDARHHCYAYILGANKEAYRINDDGEPSGTAGKPIYGQLLSKDLTNILVVVVRYFGGIKLGTPGLINAYRTATRDALDHATVVEQTVNICYQLHFEYPVMNDVMRILKDYDITPSNRQFYTDCRLDFSVRQSLSVAVYDAIAKLRMVTITVVDPLTS